ncbi:MAG: hypothetical protein GF388_08405 [Candidatus Aegiribacteria sp.]|nr:hypothetical protein [Candidatus Aegiribacteria sp.]MBD3295104.1 hypothetical protein [Candidatus Fermentibacteria bacterium]
MSFQWETEEERLKRLMSYSPRKKMQWLRKMQELILKASSRKDLELRRRLRDSR